MQLFFFYLVCLLLFLFRCSRQSYILDHIPKSVAGNQESRGFGSLYIAAQGMRLAAAEVVFFLLDFLNVLLIMECNLLICSPFVYYLLSGFSLSLRIVYTVQCLIESGFSLWPSDSFFPSIAKSPLFNFCTSLLSLRHSEDFPSYVDGVAGLLSRETQFCMLQDNVNNVKISISCFLPFSFLRKCFFSFCRAFFLPCLKLVVCFLFHRLFLHFVYIHVSFFRRYSIVAIYQTRSWTRRERNSSACLLVRRSRSCSSSVFIRSMRSRVFVLSQCSSIFWVCSSV